MHLRWELFSSFHINNRRLDHWTGCKFVGTSMYFFSYKGAKTVFWNEIVFVQSQKIILVVLYSFIYENLTDMLKINWLTFLFLTKLCYIHTMKVAKTLKPWNWKCRELQKLYITVFPTYPFRWHTCVINVSLKNRIQNHFLQDSLLFTSKICLMS